MVNLNALLRRPVEYYEYPWSLESVLCSGQATVRSLFQSPDITYIFSKSMPRGGHRLTAARAACAIRGSIDIAMPTSGTEQNPQERFEGLHASCRLFADLAEQYHFLLETHEDYKHPRGQTMASLRHR
jgi:hypothetical protein